MPIYRAKICAVGGLHSDQKKVQKCKKSCKQGAGRDCACGVRVGREKGAHIGACEAAVQPASLDDGENPDVVVGATAVRIVGAACAHDGQKQQCPNEHTGKTEDGGFHRARDLV